MTLSKQYSAQTAPPLPPGRKKSPSWAWLVLVSGVLSGVLLFTIGWYLTLPSAERDKIKIPTLPGVPLLQPKTLLVMGVDMPPRGSKNDYSGVRTDTIMLVKADPFRKQVNIVSIPRDSKVFIAGGYGVNKINAAFPLGGPEVAVQTVEQTFGIPIDNYMIVNLRGVKAFVEAVGGIDVYVEKPMHYKDYTAKLFISFEPGMHHMNGAEAEGFLRFRHDAYGDIGRIRRQQVFIAAITQKLKDPRILFQLQPLLNAANEHILTNMSTQDLVGLALFGKDLGKSNFQVSTLPGVPGMSGGVSYWNVNREQATDVLNQLIVGVSDDANAPTTPPTVGILYAASHKAGLASLEQQLEGSGFRVGCRSIVKNASTRLIVHNTHLPHAKEQNLQHAVPGLADAQLIFSPHGATFEANSCGLTDYTVILGEDIRSLPKP